MNFFEFYDIPVSFNPDENLLKKKFYGFSKEYHPDFHVNETEEKQAEILELSTINNNAYKILTNPAKRVEYVLDLYGLMQEGEKYQLPQSFLMEMMEINEVLMEIEFDEDPDRLNEIEDQVLVLEKELINELSHFTDGFESLDEEKRKNNLLKIKDNYFRQKYLLRIKEKLHTFASRN
ncbi:Fe-S protein assembly co-chaperone HscB [Solitalea canadensis]|uniref:Fe-S protein assembly co-chaperone HscB n=1 Tax=Solitalea canadensis (strain ATCC 29591 / DSM 3403 / JCM 21819 / LMG 8368 / NBRC 15130 / NCIMB 12057 / USAM 9D) TaxID=929556 RepID=H8KV57_SOLCM|nr:Fe-S protein assembly co-chaperone HscB [Solitalea canadensis]AFD06057.1 Fe-S protein assembly co-chaperone HscB [Solitalea canadensis DSM 3403]